MGNKILVERDLDTGREAQIGRIGEDDANGASSFNEPKESLHFKLILEMLLDFRSRFKADLSPDDPFLKSSLEEFGQSTNELMERWRDRHPKEAQEFYTRHRLAIVAAIEDYYRLAKPEKAG